MFCIHKVMITNGHVTGVISEQLEMTLTDDRRVVCVIMGEGGKGVQGWCVDVLMTCHLHLILALSIFSCH